MPDVPVIFPDGPVRRKPTDIRGIEDGRAEPAVMVPIGGAYLVLAFHVGLEISGDHEIIVMIQVVQQGPEALRVPP